MKKEKTNRLEKISPEDLKILQQLEPGGTIPMLVFHDFNPPPSNLKVKDFSNREEYRKAEINYRAVRLANYYAQTKLLVRLGHILGHTVSAVDSSCFKFELSVAEINAIKGIPEISHLVTSRPEDERNCICDEAAVDSKDS